MAKRGRKKKFKLKLNIKTETARSVLALVLLLLAGLSLVSFFAPDYSVNKKIQSVLMGLFGWASLIMPILLGIAGLMLIQSLKLKIKEPRIVIGLVILLVSLSGTFAVFGEKSKAGGSFGLNVSSAIAGMVSKYGAVVVFFFGMIIAFIVIFDISLEQLLGFLGDYSPAKLKSKFPFLNKGEIEGDEDVEFEVSTGLGMSEEKGEQSDSKDKSKDEKPFEEPSFEVIPSMSEPQIVEAPSFEGGGSATLSPTLPYADKVWQHPPLSLLASADNGPGADIGDVEARAKTIKETLRSFGIDVQIVDVKPGPTVTQYALKTKSGTKVSKIANLHNDLAMSLASKTGSVRIEAPIPGKSLVGIEVPNNTREMVYFRSLLSSEAMKGMKSKLGIVLGIDVAGLPQVYDIAKMPHILIAGATGSGKSVFIHNILFSILYRASPQEVKFIIVDPKRVEMSHYQGMPHLLTPVVTDMEKAPSVFRWAVAEMEKRYELFEKAKARNIEAYNEKSGFQALPYIVIVVDELAEIMARDPAGVEKSIIRLAQLARATGIHLVLAVQRPSTNIITGLIKANIPARAAFSVASQVDSRVIIDQPGAEKLLAKGDMLFIPPDAPKPVRLQGAMISDKEIENLVDYLKSQGVPTDYKEEILAMPSDTSGRGGSGGSSDWGDEVDDLFDDAVELVISAGKASASLLQRKLSIGYARAARIIDEMEEKGIVGPSLGGSRAREVLISGGASASDIGDIIAPDDPISSLHST